MSERSLWNDTYCIYTRERWTTIFFSEEAKGFISWELLEAYSALLLRRSMRLWRAACDIFNFISREPLQGNEKDDSCITTRVGQLVRSQQGRLLQLGCDQSIISYLTTRNCWLLTPCRDLPSYLTSVRYIVASMPGLEGRRRTVWQCFKRQTHPWGTTGNLRTRDGHRGKQKKRSWCSSLKLIAWKVPKLSKIHLLSNTYFQHSVNN